MVKSPSDTTLYMPALRKQVEQVHDHELIANNNDKNVQKIFEFLEAVRMEMAGGTDGIFDRGQSDGAAGTQAQVLSNADWIQQMLDEARKKAHQVTVEADKFHAKVNQPGNIPINNMTHKQDWLQNVLHQGDVMVNSVAKDAPGFSDDDFFHMICHIDDSLKTKIEKGDYIDLEKLLLKDKVSKRFSDDTHLEWVNRDGGTFLVPVSDREHKINSIRRWDQAFRVYATIYCGSNPYWSKEIWQYVSVINTAAASYMWDNVASYDYTFRHLMEFNRNRSWATTYNQMWNLCMKDPIQKGSFTKANGNSQNQPYRQVSQTTPHSVQGAGKTEQGRLKKKLNYCWYFNKGEPCKYGKKC